MPMNQVIYEKRRELGMTQEQLATYLGVTAPAVNKWEKGSTYPDITLVPALARLLKVDLNTLLCFQESLTTEEILRFQEEIARKIQEEGMDAGFVLAEQKIQEYPNSGALLEGMANLMQGSLIMSGQITEKDRYQSRITAWYERAMDCDDDTVKNRVAFMVVSQYLQKGDYEKAQQILDRVPEHNVLNKNIFQADIFEKQGKGEEAAKILQRSLLGYVNDVLGILWRLIDIEMENGKEETARALAEKAKQAAKLFDMWEYHGLIGYQSITRKKRNVQESITVLEQMLSAVEKPWFINKSPLYRHLYAETDANISISDRVLPPLLAMLEHDSEYEYLRSHKEFQELLKTYRGRVAKGEA